MRIPVCKNLSLLNVNTVFNRNRCTVRNLVTLTLLTLIVNNDDLTGARYGNKIALVMCDSLDVTQLRYTVGLDLDVVDCG